MRAINDSLIIIINKVVLMKNNSCLNRSWIDEMNSCPMEAGSIERILAKVEIILMKNNCANNLRR